MRALLLEVSETVGYLVAETYAIAREAITHESRKRIAEIRAEFIRRYEGE